MDERRIRTFEECSFNAWPARQTRFFGGWVFRLSDGLTKRANSGNAIEPAISFSEVQETAERLYARHHLPAIFRLTPLASPEADVALNAAHYILLDPSLVLVAPLLRVEYAGDVKVDSTPSALWLVGFACAKGIDAAQRANHDRIVSSIATPCAFATLQEEDGTAIGFGLGVYERNAVGIFDVVVTPSRRGRGNGQKITSALMHWGLQMGPERPTCRFAKRTKPPVHSTRAWNFAKRTAIITVYRAPSRRYESSSPARRFVIGKVMVNYH